MPILASWDTQRSGNTTKTTPAECCAGDPVAWKAFCTGRVWDPGLKERRDALHAVDRRIAELLAPLAPRHLLDLGCGTGASALWLAQRLPAHVTGVTLSSVQARLAREQAAARGLTGRCRFLETDYLHLPDMEPADAAYAIESFTHAETPGAFFAAQRRPLLPGGLLVLCDDFLENSSPQSKAEALWVQRFRTGWCLPTLGTMPEACRQAAAHGFRVQLSEDLTPLLRLTSPCVLALRRLLPLVPLVGTAARSSLSGGTALQVCLRSGWVRYRFLVFRMEEG